MKLEHVLFLLKFSNVCTQLANLIHITFRVAFIFTTAGWLLIMSYRMARCPLMGDYPLRDATDHEKIEKTASSFKYRRAVEDTRNSLILKCKKQILVCLVI